MKNLTASLEDYLEVIYNYSNKNKSIRAIDISKELKISRASVSEALKKLTQKGYINYGQHEALALTDLGKETAQKILYKHTTLETFFEKILELDKNEATKNACKIEHVITDRAFSQIVNFMKNNKVEIKCEY